MNTFEPGRVYSGIVDGKRQIVFCDSEHWHHVDAAGVLCGGGHFNGSYTDVRGPLVVLDLGGDPGAARWIVTQLRENSDDKCLQLVADQIEEQTRPPLQVGWHEVEHSHDWIGRTVREWRDGEWHNMSGHRDATQDWTSTHYIGPGSDAS